MKKTENQVAKIWFSFLSKISKKLRTEDRASEPTTQTSDSTFEWILWSLSLISKVGNFLVTSTLGPLNPLLIVIEDDKTMIWFNLKALFCIFRQKFKKQTISKKLKIIKKEKKYKDGENPTTKDSPLLCLVQKCRKMNFKNTRLWEI